jgi:hypothetical protein
MQPSLRCCNCHSHACCVLLLNLDGCATHLQLSSVPAKQYVQQLYNGSATQAAGMRSSTVDWMVEAAQQLKLSSDSLFLGVQLLDRFLAAVLQACTDSAAVQAFLQSDKLQLAAITALWVAAKFEESCVPGASTFVQHLPAASHGNCHMLLQQLLEAEQVLLTTVDHRLAAPTAKTFLRRYLARVAVSRPMYFAAGYVAELSLLDSGMLCFLPSMVAASAYVWGLKLMGIECDDKHVMQLSGRLGQQKDGAAGMLVARKQFCMCCRGLEGALLLVLCTSACRKGEDYTQKG